MGSAAIRPNGIGACDPPLNSGNPERLAPGQCPGGAAMLWLSEREELRRRQAARRLLAIWVLLWGIWLDEPTVAATDDVDPTPSWSAFRPRVSPSRALCFRGWE